jgi:protein-tyrosine phosphatase
MAINNFSWVIPKTLAGSAMPGGIFSYHHSYVLSDLQDLFDEGIRSLISLEFMPASFGSLCESAGITWVYYPLEDFTVPKDIPGFERIVDESMGMMRQGVPVCVHCRAGIGRTGLMLSCIAGKYYSLEASAAIAFVRKKRSALESEEQIDFVSHFLQQSTLSGTSI